MWSLLSPVSGHLRRLRRYEPGTRREQSERDRKTGFLTLLSQLPTARYSACGEKDMQEMESGGGSATSISFS